MRILLGSLPTIVFSLAKGCRAFPGGVRYTSPMRFQCQPGCIECCEQPGHIYLSSSDVARLSRHLKLTQAEFHRQYVCGTKGRERLRKPRAKQCPFLLSDGCGVHVAKPLQCKAFPFWPEILDKASERRDAAAYCPGLGKGPLVNIRVARRVANQMLREYPDIYQPGEE